MASTAGKLDIFNMALGFIGTRTIGSPNERTPEAIQCELYWDRARRAALRDYPYNFARRRFLLAEKAMPDIYAGEWRCCYGVPDTCLKVSRLLDERGRPRPFQLVHEGGQSVILADADKARADCTCDVDDISLWDELFVAAMARKLAALIAVPLLKNNPNKVQELEQLYQMAIPRANGQDASEEHRGKPADTWLLARGMW